MLKDLELGLHHWTHVEREAVVTVAHRVHAMTPIGDALFPDIEVRAFPNNAREDARAGFQAECKIGSCAGMSMTPSSFRHSSRPRR